ncbi:MAG: hypothetical protein IKD69_04600 [Solobacterium sp.]|nr:hypothetical protein [Solobacterium sp.]
MTNVPKRKRNKEMAGLVHDLLARFEKNIVLTEKPLSYRQPMTWPKMLPVMKLQAGQYRAEGFGHVMTLETNAMGGFMKLATIVFTPNEGYDIPLLLLDIMFMGDKTTVFAEYYDLAETEETQALDQLYEAYQDLDDYKERPHWYIQERAPYSLIKSVKADQKGRILRMALEEAEIYGLMARYAFLKGASEDEKAFRRSRIKAFQDRMVKEGNPSEEALKRVLGSRAEAFFREVIMPAQQEEK